MSQNIKISIHDDFTRIPGPRYRSDGPFSGEQFREEKLEKYFEDLMDTTIIEIYLDGVAGYPPSFLEEAFGGLVRKYGRDRVKKKIILIAERLKFFKRQAEEYIDNAKDPL